MKYVIQIVAIFHLIAFSLHAEHQQIKDFSHADIAKCKKTPTCFLKRLKPGIMSKSTEMFFEAELAHKIKRFSL